MNIKTNDHRLGGPIICVGIGIHLLILELVRLINFYATKYFALASETYMLSCFVCSTLIAAGVILLMLHRVGIVPALILGVVSFCFLGVGLFYSAYVIPFLQNNDFQEIDWLLVSLTCLIGSLFVVWGLFILFKRK